MKFLPPIAAALLIILSTTVTTTVANAAIIHLGNLAIGQTGYVPNNVELIESGYAYGLVDGYLPNNAVITFTYNTNNLPPGSVQALSIYAIGHPMPLSSSFAPASLPPSVFLPVSVVIGPTTAVITNMTGNAAYFTSYFLSLIGLSLPGDASTYVVSAIPLPPALMLMMASVAGLGGLAARRKIAKASSELSTRLR